MFFVRMLITTVLILGLSGCYVGSREEFVSRSDAKAVLPSTVEGVLSVKDEQDLDIRILRERGSNDYAMSSLSEPNKKPTKLRFFEIGSTGMWGVQAALPDAGGEVVYGLIGLRQLDSVQIDVYSANISEEWLDRKGISYSGTLKTGIDLQSKRDLEQLMAGILIDNAYQKTNTIRTWPGGFAARSKGDAVGAGDTSSIVTDGAQEVSESRIRIENNNLAQAIAHRIPDAISSQQETEKYIDYRMSIAIKSHVRNILVRVENNLEKKPVMCNLTMKDLGDQTESNWIYVDRWCDGREPVLLEQTAHGTQPVLAKQQPSARDFNFVLQQFFDLVVASKTLLETLPGAKFKLLDLTYMRGNTDRMTRIGDLYNGRADDVEFTVYIGSAGQRRLSFTARLASNNIYESCLVQDTYHGSDSTFYFDNECDGLFEFQGSDLSALHRTQHGGHMTAEHVNMILSWIEAHMEIYATYVK